MHPGSQVHSLIAEGKEAKEKWNYYTKTHSDRWCQLGKDMAQHTVWIDESEDVESEVKWEAHAGRRGEKEIFITRQSPIGGKDTYNSIWTSIANMNMHCKYEYPEQMWTSIASMNIHSKCICMQKDRLYIFIAPSQCEFLVPPNILE